MNSLMDCCWKQNSIAPVFSLGTQRLIAAESIELPQVFIDLDRKNTYRAVHLSLKEIEYSRTHFHCCFGCSLVVLAIFITCLATKVLSVNGFSISATAIAAVFFVIFTYCLCCCDLPDDEAEKDDPLLDVRVDRSDKALIRDFLSEHYNSLKMQFTQEIKRIEKIQTRLQPPPTHEETQKMGSLFLYQKALEELDAIFQYYQTKSRSSSSSGDSSIGSDF